MVSPSSISNISPMMPASAVPLAEVSVQNISTILENLGFSSLVAPFKEIGVDGRMISEMKSFFAEVVLGHEVSTAFKAFFEGHVLHWQRSGMIPIELLSQRDSRPRPVGDTIYV